MKATNTGHKKNSKKHTSPGFTLIAPTFQENRVPRNKRFP